MRLPKRIAIVFLVLMLLSLACSSTTNRVLKAAEESTKIAATGTALPATAVKAVSAETKATATVAPSPTAAKKTEPIRLTGEQGFYQDDIEVLAAFMVENPNQTVAIENSSYQITVLDEAGATLKTDNGYLPALLPGEKQGVAADLYLEEGQKAAKFEVTLESGQPNPTDVKPPVFAADQVTFVPDQYFPKVTAVISNGLGVDVTNLKVTAIAWDESGKIIGGGYTYFDFIKSGGKAGVDVQVKVGVKPAKVELYASLSGLSSADKQDAGAPKLELVSTNLIQDKYQTATVVFFVKNADPSQSIESSQYQVAIYDADEKVLSSDSGYIQIVLPGEQTAIAADLSVPTGKKAARAEVNLLSGEAKDAGDVKSIFTTDQVQVQAGDFPKVTGTLHNGLARKVSDVRLFAVVYDASDKVIGGGSSFVSFLPASGQSPVEVSVKIDGTPARAELYASLSGLSALEAGDKEALGLELVDFAMVKGTYSSQIVFRVKNNSTSILQGSQYQASAYDKEGNVLDTEEGYVSTIFAGETLGQAADLLIPEGKTVDHVDVQLSVGSPVVLDQTENPLKGLDATFVPDQFMPKFTGQVQNTIDQQIKDFMVVAIAYDGEGKIIGSGYTYVDFITAKGKTAVEITGTVQGTPAKVELFPALISLSKIGE